MRRLQIVLSDDTEQSLRDTIYKTKGSWKKGYISAAVEEAIREWVIKNSKSTGAKRIKKPLTVG